MPVGNPTLTQILADHDASQGQRYIGNLFERNNVLMQLLPFDNSVAPRDPDHPLIYSYSRQANMRLAQFRDFYQDYDPAFVNRESVSTQLKVFGDKFAIDRVFNRADVSQFVELNIGELAAAAMALFNDTVMNGDVAVTPLGFNGLNTILTGTPSEISAAGTDISSASTEAARREAMVLIKRYVNRIRQRGLVPTILTNEDGALRMEATAEALGYVEKRVTNWGQDVRQYSGADIVQLGVKPSVNGTGAEIIPTTSGDTVTPANNGLTDIYIVGFGLRGFHGATLTGAQGVTYYNNLGDTNPGVTKAVEAEMVATVALKDIEAAYVLRDVRVVPV